MSVKQLTDYLYEAGHGSDEVIFRVKGEVNHTEEVLREMSGDYDFSAEVDHRCVIDDIDRNSRGEIIITLEIAGIYT